MTSGAGADGTAHPTVVPYGDDAVLVELADLRAVRAVDARLRAAAPPGVVDVVPAARTVLVRGEARTRPLWARATAHLVRSAVGDQHAAGPVRTVEVPVVYDGEDLSDVARLAGVSPDEVVARHLAGGPDGYRVAFGGFMPGFAYVVGVDPLLTVPRLDSPRTRVPPGSVALAGEFTAVYPAATPGGWRLLGTSPRAMFDAARGTADAALLVPGDVVRFVRTTPPPVTATTLLGTTSLAPSPPAPTSPARAEPDAPPRTPGPAAPTAAARTLAVVAPGPLALVQDLGRPGLAAVGVPRSGAADPAALARANRLVGNDRAAAGIELVLGGLVVTFGAPTAFALVGAVLPASLDGRAVAVGVALRAPAGSTLRLGAPAAGLRTWLAVRGGLDVPPVLGSRSRDVLSALGPAPLRAGDVAALGHAFDGLPVVDAPDSVAATPDDPGADPRADPRPAPHPATSTGAPVVLPATPGPRLDHLDAASRARLWTQVWDVTPDSNRVAVRLDGRALTRATGGELASEGLVVGAVQVPHDGRPVLFGPDHPVTGGYPVVAVLTRDGAARAAQLRPGDRVRLAPA